MFEQISYMIVLDIYLTFDFIYLLSVQLLQTPPLELKRRGDRFSSTKSFKTLL